MKTMKVHQLLRVWMEKYVWLELEEVTLQDELSFAIMEYGEQYVMMDGTTTMLEWSVDNLDCQLQVSII